MMFNVISNDFPNNSKCLLEFARKYFPEATVSKFNFRTYEEHPFALRFWKYIACFGPDNFHDTEATMEVLCIDDFISDEESEVYCEDLTLSEVMEFIKASKKEYDSEQSITPLVKRRFKVIEGGKK